MDLAGDLAWAKKALSGKLTILDHQLSTHPGEVLIHAKVQAQFAYCMEAQ